jgi:hypothetical protein
MAKEDDLVKVSSEEAQFLKHIIPTEMTKKACKFCCSENRHKAEEEYSKMSNTTGGYLAAHKFLQSKGELISYTSVKNHLIYHFARKELEERIREFGDEMERWTTSRPTREHRLENFIDILYRRIQILESHIDTTDSKDNTRISEVIVKLMDQVNKCQTELDKSRQQIDLVRMFIGKFTKIVQQHMETSTSKETNMILGQALISVLESAQQLLGEMTPNE